MYVYVCVCMYIFFLQKKNISFPVATSIASAQILVSNYHSPGNRNRDPWRNGYF